MSRISIYMSSYNHADYIRESINTVLNQTFADYELFIVDDASTDDSWAIIQSFTDPRIRSFRNKTNRNDREWMRKVVFELASGEYIAVHHSDNVWEPEKLQKQVDLLDGHPEMGAVFTNTNIIDENSRPFEDKAHFYYKIFDQPNRSRHEWLNFFFYRGNALCHPSILIRKKCYQECGFYRNGLALIADLDMWVRLCMKYEIHVIPEKLVRFRVRTDEKQSSGNRPETRIRNQFEYLQVLGNYPGIPTYAELVKIFPTAGKYYRSEGCDIGYILGRTALETRNEDPLFVLFGLEQLFEAINDPVRAGKIKELYSFTHKELTALTGKYDIFSIEMRSDPYLQDVQARESQVDVIMQSKTWKIASFLDRVRAVLAPENSLRDRGLRKLLKFMRS